MKRTFNKLSCTLLVLLLSFCAVFPAWAADAEDGEGSQEGVPTLGTVPITASSYFELKDLNILPDSGGKNVAFTVSVYNNDTTDLMFIDYWVHVATKSGNQVSVRILPEDKDINRIYPQTSRDIDFYATINENTELSDLIFTFIKWDFSQPNFERALGEIAVSDTYSVVTPLDSARVVKMTGIPMKTNIKKLLLNRNEKNYNATVVLEMENVGAKSIAVPAYTFAIRTSEGYMYPLDAKNLKDLAINPQVKKEIDLSGSIPVTVTADGWQLVIMQNMADLKLNLAVAYFALPEASQTEGVDVGKDYTITTDDGTYHAQVNAFYRLPWEDEDIMTANLQLSNQDLLSLPIPELTGYFELDEAVKVEAKLISTDKVIGLRPGASINYQFVGKMPYTYEFTKVKLVLQEKVSDTAADDLLEFVNSAEMMNVPYNNVGEQFEIAHIGRSASYMLRRVDMLQGDTSDMIMAQLEVTNQEKRHAGVTRLIAQFKTPDGTVFPAKVSDIEAKISPGGKALLLLTAKLPKTYPTTGMHVLIGESLTDGKLTEKGGTPNAYMNAAAFWLPQEMLTVQNNLMDIELAPYKLSINRIATNIEMGKLKLKFNYELKRDILAETNTEGRKLIIGFEDENGNKTFLKEFEFKDFEEKKPSDGTKDTKIRLGQTNEFIIEETDQDLIYKLETLKTYKLSVYDSFEGNKKLLGTQKIDWFSTTD
jgi:hypothetical protein